MAHGMGWNGLEWVGMGWNGLDGPWNGLEWVGMAHGMGWNLLEWPLESSGMNLESVGMEFHLDSIGIQQNDRFQPFRRIPGGIPTFQLESIGVRQKPWGIVKYCNQLLRSKKIGIFAIQETHLRESTIHELHAQFPQHLYIINSSVPEHPNVMGVWQENPSMLAYTWADNGGWWSRLDRIYVSQAVLKGS